MTATRRLQRQRYLLWKPDPHCYWCGIKTVLPSKKWVGKAISPNLATIDHLRPRHHPLRHERPKGIEYRRVLACWKCNNERDRAEHEAMPRERLWAMSNNYPLEMKPLDEMKRIEAHLAEKEPRGNANKKRVQRSLDAVRAAIAMKESIAA